MNTIRIYYEVNVSNLKLHQVSTSSACSLCRKAMMVDNYFRVSIHTDYHGNQYICKNCLIYIVSQPEYDMIEVLNLIPITFHPLKDFARQVTKDTPYIERSIPEGVTRELNKNIL